MAFSALALFSTRLPDHLPFLPAGSKFTTDATKFHTTLKPPATSNSASTRMILPRVLSNPDGVLQGVLDVIQASPPTWESAILNNVLIFSLGSPILVTGLSAPGIATAFMLGTLTWRAFGYAGFLLVATYFIIGTAVTKLKIAQKEALGVAEKRKGRRGPGSVIGSSAAGCVCAFCAIYEVGGPSLTSIWQLGFVASFCTKLSDTVSSEIGKAYGKTTYLATTFKIVPKGTEGAVSVEGTVAGLLASILLAGVACLMGQINTSQVVTCVIASQIANFGESIVGASLQEKEGFRWIVGKLVNMKYDPAESNKLFQWPPVAFVFSILAVLIQKVLLESWKY